MAISGRILSSVVFATVLSAGLAALVQAQPAQPQRDSDPDTGYAGPQRPPARSLAPGAARQPDLPAPPPAGAPQPPQDNIQKEREWLVAYLIAHQGYRIDQMDALEKRIDRMSPTQVQTLVEVYRQKHDLALQREQAYQQMRNQAFAAQTADYNRRLQQEQTYRQELDAGAQAEQARLNQQQQQAMQNFQENAMMHQPYYFNAPTYMNPYYGGYFYDRYWH